MLTLRRIAPSLTSFFRCSSMRSTECKASVSTQGKTSNCTQNTRPTVYWARMRRSTGLCRDTVWVNEMSRSQRCGILFTKSTFVLSSSHALLSGCPTCSKDSLDDWATFPVRNSWRRRQRRCLLMTVDCSLGGRRSVPYVKPQQTVHERN